MKFFLHFIAVAYCAPWQPRYRATPIYDIDKLKNSSEWNAQEKVKKYVLEGFSSTAIFDLLTKAEQLQLDDSEIDFIRKGGDDGNLIYKKIYAMPDDHDLATKVANEISMQSAAHVLAPDNVPNILHAYFEDKLSSNGDMWVVMEAAKGDPLKTLVKSEKWDTGKADFFISQIEKILQKLHDKQLYHRDLHLGNILVSPSMQVSLIDFGESRFDDHEDAIAPDNFALSKIAEILNTEDLKQRQKLSDELAYDLGTQRDANGGRNSPTLSVASTTASEEENRLLSRVSRQDSEDSVSDLEKYRKL